MTKHRLSKWPLVPLGDLGDIVSGSTPKTHVKEYWEGDIPWITPADLSNHEGIYFTGELRKITKAGYESCSTRLLPKGSILFSSRAPIGHCAVTAYPLCTNQGFKSIIPNDQLDSVFGFFALKYFTPEIEALGRGATFSEVTKEIIEDFPIPLPPLPEQQRIAARLDKADRLRRLRRYALELGETYLQSVFLEMFGDPRSNPKGWEFVEFEDLVSFVSGHSFKFSEYSDSGIRLLQIANVGFQEVLWDTVAYLPVEYVKSYPKLALKPGDLLMALNRPILGHKVKFAVLSESDCPAILYQRVGKIVIETDKLIRDYLFGFMLTRYFYHELKIRLAGTDQPYINPTELVKMRFMLPPLALQQKFAGIVRQYDRLRAQQREALRQAEHLFQTLLHRAFEGKV